MKKNAYNVSGFMAKKQGNKDKTLTDKQKRFADEYLIDLNATQAAIRAGYSERTANSQGTQILSITKVQEYIAERKNALDKHLENKYLISKERLLQEYARIGFSDLRNYYDESGNLRPVTEMSLDEAAALSSIKVHEQFTFANGAKIPDGVIKEIKVYDKLRALEGIRKVMGYDAPIKQDHTSGGKSFADFLREANTTDND